MNASRIKIAVLDTGIDWGDSFIRGARERLKGWRNWADDRQQLDEREQVYDASGHGTHVAALLLKTSPESDVYVGRVADANGCMIAPEKIAEVSQIFLFWNPLNDPSLH
jgi:subtilisin family serine protease